MNCRASCLGGGSAWPARILFVDVLGLTLLVYLAQKSVVKAVMVSAHRSHALPGLEWTRLRQRIGSRFDRIELSDGWDDCDLHRLFGITEVFVSVEETVKRELCHDQDP